MVFFLPVCFRIFQIEKEIHNHSVANIKCIMTELPLASRSHNHQRVTDRCTGCINNSCNLRMRGSIRLTWYFNPLVARKSRLNQTNSVTSMTSSWRFISTPANVSIPLLRPFPSSPLEIRSSSTYVTRLCPSPPLSLSFSRRYGPYEINKVINPPLLASVQDN